MKALIVDIEGNYAVAMTKNGKFIKIKNTGNLSLGSETDISDKKSPSIIHIVRYGSIAAAVLFIIGFGSFLYTSPYSYVDVDINPSIEITTNIFDRIIKIHAINPDGEIILEDLNVTNKEIDDGVKEILGSAIKNGYLKNSDSSAVLFTVSSSNNNKAIKLNNNIKNAAITKFKAENINPEILTQEIKKADYKKTDSQKVSPGKLVLINKLLTIDPTLKRVDLEEKSIKEITKAIKESKLSNKNKNEKITTATSTPISNSDPTQEKNGVATSKANDKNNDNIHNKSNAKDNDKNNNDPKGKSNDRPNNKADRKIKDTQSIQNNANDKNKNSDFPHKNPKNSKKGISNDSRNGSSTSTSFTTPGATPNVTSTVNPQTTDISKPGNNNSIEKPGIKDSKLKTKDKENDKNNKF